jgi:hypothetical protein
MRSALALALAVLLPVAAGCNNNDGSGGSGGAGGTFPTEGATVNLSCLENDPVCVPAHSSQGVATATDFDLCNYWDSTHNFIVTFRGSGSEITVKIANFTGTGDYTTTSDDATSVFVASSGSVPSGATSTDLAVPCTITVESNLADIQIPQSGNAALLNVALDVSCPLLNAGSTCNVDCTLSPTPSSLSVGGCVVSQ